MLSTRTAHTLLATATSHEALLPFARALGFTGHAHTPGPRTIAAMGLAALGTLTVTRVVRDDSAAVLLVSGATPERWRETLLAIVTHLDRLTDPRRWLVILRTTDTGPLAIATWLSSTKGPRLAVLATHPGAVLDSDAQTVAALAAAWHHDPSVTAMHWHDLLGRHAIGRRFFRALNDHVTDIATAWPARVIHDDRRTLALIHVARLLFLKFLETKGWLDNDRHFLANHADALLGTGKTLWNGLVAPLTFGTLNTPRRHRAPSARAFGHVPFLNGGLFACSATERRARRPAISDDLLAPLLLDTFAHFRFTAREDARAWSEAAIDPDLLGRTFEALMEPAQRRGSGTFYTPSTLVTTLVDDALAHAIPLPTTLVRAALDGALIAPPDARRLRTALTTLRVLDPACGSGSLLVATLERLATLHTQLGSARPMATLRRDILTRSIFGLDIAPMAVWICELRLWLSVVIDDDTVHPHDIAPLPNLDHHIRTGDALGPHAFDDAAGAPTSRRLTTLRERYARSTGSRKLAVATRISTLERENAQRLTAGTLATLRHERASLLLLARQRSLFGTRTGLTATQRRRLATIRSTIAEHRRTLRKLDDGATPAFDFRTHFSDAAATNGFDLVIGNPPWIRSQHLDRDTRTRLRTRFASVMRHTDASTRFGVQTDIAIPFTQRGLELTRPGGILAFLLPAKHWRSVAGGALRHHLLQHARPLHLRDQSHDSGGFSAAVYPSTIVVRRNPRAGTTPESHMPIPDMECHTTDALGQPHGFHIPAIHLAATEHPGAPWRIIPADVRTAADTISRAGGRWMDTLLPPPSLGIKTGSNDAFLLATDGAPHTLDPWLRPALRGDHVRPWHTAVSPVSIVVPCDRDGRTLKRLPSALSKHFAPHERTLTARTDLRPRDPWWSLFRTELLAGTGWRVVWADIGRHLRATILPPHDPTVPLNTCYGIRLHDPVDAHALTALLNAPLSTAWLSLVAEPARGGYLRFLGWTVLALPVPDWQRARELLAPLAARARRGDPVSVHTLHQATLDAYGLRHSDVAPLLAWTSHTLRNEPLETSRAS